MVQEARQDSEREGDTKSSPAPAVGTLPSPTTPPDAILGIAEKVSLGEASLTRPKASKGFLHHLTHVMLTLSLVTFVGFIGGAALTASILLGVLDFETGWIKDLITFAKEALKHLRS